MPFQDDLQPAGGWQQPASQRLPLRSGFLQRLVAAGSRLLVRIEPSNLFVLLQSNSRLFWPWLAFASRLMPFGRLDVRDRERVILRVAWNCRSRYEWGQHLSISLRSGLPRAEIPWIAAGPTRPEWDAHGRALLLACDEFHSARCLSDATWTQLHQHYGDKQMVELLLLIGHYEMLAGVLNSTGLRLEQKFEAGFKL